MAFVHLATAAGGSEAAARASTAFALIVGLALLLGLFLLGVVLIMTARRVRHRRTRQLRSTEPPQLDPWKESARRLKPYPPHQHDDSSSAP